MTTMLWKLIAFILSRPRVADWIIRRAMRTPYFHLAGYMERYWLFNGYSSDQSLTPAERRKAKRFPWFPYSIRIHHILRADTARHKHDHPWAARTIVLRGFYVEDRILSHGVDPALGPWSMGAVFHRFPGDTATLKVGEWHDIKYVSPGGVWTFFIVGDFEEDWGFLVNGKKVLHKDYRDEFEDR